MRWLRCLVYIWPPSLYCHIATEYISQRAPVTGALGNLAGRRGPQVTPHADGEWTKVQERNGGLRPWVAQVPVQRD